MAREMKDSGIEWIGEIPREWDIRKLKYCSEFIQDKYSDKNGELEYIGLENISSWSGKYISTDSQYDRAQSLLFQAEDILWGKLRPYLAKVYHTKKSGCCSSEFCVIRVSKDYSIRYFWNLLISSEFVYAIDRSTYGTKMPRANAEFIRNTFIPVPDKHEQQAIADFLDTQCTHIDSVIEKTRAAIEEYKKLKQAVITQAVTKGIRPNREMKDSGIEWIGEIPTSWDMVKLKYFLSSDKVNLRVGPFGSSLSGGDFKQEGVWVYNQRVVIDNNFSDNNTFVSEEKFEELKGFEVLPDDILITTRGSIGKVAIVPLVAEKGILHPCVIKFRVNQSLISHAFIWHIFNNTDIAMRQIKDMSNSTTIEVLYSYSLKNVQIPLIPKDEWEELEGYIDKKVNEFDHIIECKNQLITELEAYKKSLIYEYVTGKKEAPAHAH